MIADILYRFNIYIFYRLLLCSEEDASRAFMKSRMNIKMDREMCVAMNARMKCFYRYIYTIERKMKIDTKQ